MGLIVNEINPWGKEHKCALAIEKVLSVGCEEVKGDEFYVVSTPQFEEERRLCFAAKDKQGVRVLIATLNGVIHTLNKLLNEAE